MPPRRRRRWRKRLTRSTPRLGDALVWSTLALQAGTLLVFTLDPIPGWANRPVPAEFWALGRQWQFHLLLAALLGGPVLSALAFRLRAPWRWTLLAAWPAFLLLLLTEHERQLRIMLDLIRRHG